VLDGEIALPCNITAPSFDDGVSLVLWYRDDVASPIYTVDARQSVSLETAQHFLHADIFEKRASFNLSYPLSFLRIKPVISTDGADYRCRVDFRRARTRNTLLKLTVIGKWIWIDRWPLKSQFVCASVPCHSGISLLSHCLLGA